MSIDQRELRDVLGAFVTGVTIITTTDGAGLPYGVTVNSFASVSLDPPLVLWSQGLKAHSFPVFRDAQRFVVNILAKDQVELSRRFSSPLADRFRGVAYHAGRGGLPVLDGCLATLECVKVNTYPGGDHLVHLGQIEQFQRSARRPLAFMGGRYSLTCEMDSV